MGCSDKFAFETRFWSSYSTNDQNICKFETGPTVEHVLDEGDEEDEEDGEAGGYS